MAARRSWLSGRLMPFVGDQFRAAGAGVRDANVQAIGFLPFDHASDAAIVQPDALTRLGVLEHLRRGAADGRGIQHVTGSIAGGRPARCEFPGQRESDRPLPRKWRFDVGEPADTCFAEDSDTVALGLQLGRPA